MSFLAFRTTNEFFIGDCMIYFIDHHSTGGIFRDGSKENAVSDMEPNCTPHMAVNWLYAKSILGTSTEDCNEMFNR